MRIFGQTAERSLLTTGVSICAVILALSIPSVATAQTYQGNDAYAMTPEFFTNQDAIYQAISDGIVYPAGYEFPSEVEENPDSMGMPPEGDKPSQRTPQEGEMSLSQYVQGATTPSLEDVSRIVGDSDISMSGGAFQYSYPFDLPKGRNGFGPNLALNYSSQNTDYFSTTGFGWSLNIPYIERKNEKGSQTLYLEDNFVSSLSGDLATTSTPGSYVSKVDNGSYLKYTYATSTWTVLAKDGTKYTFGSTTSARQDSTASSTQVYRWMLQEMQDANGNKVLYTYAKDQGQIYPSSIKYVYTGSTPLYTIDFAYATSSAPLVSHANATPVVTAKRLSTVSITVGTVLDKRYDLTYNKAIKGDFDLLTQIQLWGLSGADINMPPTTFTYRQDASGGTWENDEDWATSIPADFYTYYYDEVNGPSKETYGRGVLIDINGDGLSDWIQSGIAYLNTGSGWSATSTWAMPTTSSYDVTYRLADVNGDSLPDVIRSSQTVWAPPWNHATDIYKEVHINQGDGTWVNDAALAATIPAFFHTHYLDGVNGPSQDYYYRGYLVDMNGDRLADWMQGGIVYMNNGAGWSTTNQWTSLPASSFEKQWRLSDVNGDSLPDMIRSSHTIWAPSWNHAEDIYKEVQINQGNGTWVNDAARAATIPSYLHTYIQGDGSIQSADYYNQAYLVDIDGDGFSDWLSGSNAILNTGTVWSTVYDWGLPTSADFRKQLRIGDVNGDNLPDIVHAYRMIWSQPWNHADDVTREVYINQELKPYSLINTTNEYGGTTTIEYSQSAYPVDGEIVNPNMPMGLEVVKSVTQLDSVTGTSWTTEYLFEEGDLYYQSGDIFDRQFAGFGKVSIKDDIGTTVSYFHQGNSTATSTGEVLDTKGKLGKQYRSDILSNGGYLYSSKYSQWNQHERGGDARFVYAATSTALTFDGNASHRDAAETYVYDLLTGNLSQHKVWGEVTATTSGSFTDLGTDSFLTSTTYATSTGSAYLSLPLQQTLTNYSGGKVSETRNYYDGLNLGQASIGNKTREESWISSATYVRNAWTYNALGMVTSMADPRGATTTQGYDAYNLYVASTTNALGHNTQYLYDYSSGLVTKVTDPNALVTQTQYDSLDRLTLIKVPDLVTPATLVNKTMYVYINATSTNSVQRIDYLDAANLVRTYTFLDGFGRVSQERKRAEATNAYKVTNKTYDVRGNAATESLPYLSTGALRTVPVSMGPLWKEYAYDPANRILSVGTALGNTTYAYDDWTATTTDVLGRQKSLTSDAFGNLLTVTEKNGSTLYFTRYVWNGNKKLTKITDANKNIRNFTYDGLGRMLKAEDLHAPSDTTFASTTYAYDSASNRTKQIRPSGANIDYTYDILNRVLTEDTPGTPYTDVSYAYDNSFHYGKGKLANINTGYVGSGFDYDANGNRSAEQHVIPGSATTTTYYTYDRLGNITYITYPDNSNVYYAYNGAGLVNSVQELENGSSTWTPIVNNFDYSPLDQVSLIQYANGVTATSTYDAAHMYRLKIKGAYNSSEYLQFFNYGYDSMGNIVYMADSASSSAYKQMYYTYDDLYRLTSASTTNAVGGLNYKQTYTYNPIGNLLSHAGASYSYAGNTGTNYANPHAPTSVASTTYTYDLDGNLLTDGTLTNTWSYKGELMQILTNTGTTTITSTYTYNHKGDRVSKTAGNLTTFYPNQYYSTNTAGVEDKYVFANGLALANIRDNGATTSVHYLVHDHLGSTNLSTNSSGAAEERLDYYPFGSIRMNDAISFDESRKYIGQHYDAVTELSYLNARYYDSGRGQFVSQDPMFWNLSSGLLADPQNQNSYSYARNNPISASDPSGLFSIAGIRDNVANSVFQFARSVSGYVKNAVYYPKQTLQKTAATVLNRDFIPAVFASNVNQVTSTVNNLFSSDPAAQDKGAASVITIGLTLRAPPSARIADTVGDAALVCRGGACAADSFIKGSNEFKAGLNPTATTPLTGISVNTGATKDVLIQYLQVPYKQAGFTPRSQLDRMGQYLQETPRPNNPYHADINGLNAQQLVDLFKVEPIR